MNRRPLHSLALTSLLAMTQILSACGDGSTRSSSPVPGAAEPGSPPPPPSNGPVVNSDAAGVDDADMLANLLATGADSNDTASYWGCSDNNEASQFLRFWQNGSGYLSKGENEGDMQWQATSPSSAELASAGDTITLSELFFIDEDVPFDRFVATRGTDERIDCRWGGPSRYNELGVQADSTAGLPQLLAGNASSRNWSCTVNQPDGSVTTSVLNYAIDRSGAGETGAFDWYFDDDLLFMASNGGEDIAVFHDFSLGNDDPANGPLSFSAQDREASLSCESNG